MARLQLWKAMSTVQVLYLLVTNSLLISAELSTSENFQLNLSSDYMQTFISVHTSHSVSHLTEDKFVPGNFLFSDAQTLRTTNGDSTYLVVGSIFTTGHQEGTGSEAKFNVIQSFYQLNETHLILTEAENDCVTLIDRRTNSSSTYAGICNTNERGFRDGVGSSARFHVPSHIIEDVKNTSRLLVTDNHNYAVRTLDRTTPTVGTFFKSTDTIFFAGVVQDSVTGNLYFTIGAYIARMNYYNKIVEVIAGTPERSLIDGPFADTRFNSLAEILLIHNRTKLVVADRGNGRLRVLDFTSNTTSSICSGSWGQADGDFASCSLIAPEALYIHDGTLYIGADQHIRYISANPVEKTRSELTDLETEKTIIQSSTLSTHPTEPNEDVAVGTTTTTGAMESNTVIITAIFASTALLIAVVVGLVCCYWRKVKTGGATSTMNNQNSINDNESSMDEVYYSAISVPGSDAYLVPVNQSRQLPKPPTIKQQIDSPKLEPNKTSGSSINNDSKHPHTYADSSIDTVVDTSRDDVANDIDFYIVNVANIQSARVEVDTYEHMLSTRDSDWPYDYAKPTNGATMLANQNTPACDGYVDQPYCDKRPDSDLYPAPYVSHVDDRRIHTYANTTAEEDIM